MIYLGKFFGTLQPIRFLGSVTARPLKTDRLRSALLQSALHHLFTRTERCSVRAIEFNMSMFRFVLLCQFSILLEIVVALLLLFCLKLKSGLFKRIFLIIQKPYLCVYCNSAMAGPSDAMCEVCQW